MKGLGDVCVVLFFHIVFSCLQPKSIKKTDLFFKFFASYFYSNEANYMRPRKLLKRRFICDQSQVSSSIHLEVIKNQRGMGQNLVLQKTSILRDFSPHELSSFLHNF